ncbi:MAG: insulinase family protein [Deltaproteobacteria bacterium]|nr:insulinase family protein [Deltaproteobacteria bacterium]
MRTFAALWACALLGCDLQPAARPEDYSFPLFSATLPSGLQILLEEDHRAPIAGVVWVVAAGSAQDPPGREGLAHLVEHLVFAAKHDGKVEAFNHLADLGVGSLNGFTDFDSTVYHAYAAKAAIAELTAFELSRMLDPLAGVDDAMLRREIAVVSNELLLRTESSDTLRFFPPLLLQVFPRGHPYRHGPGGTLESVATITLADVRAFVAKHYVPEKLTLMLSGDISDRESDALLGLVPARLAGDKTRPVVRQKDGAVRREIALAPPSEMTRHEAHIPAPELWLAWALPGGIGPDDVAADFAAYLSEWRFNDAFFVARNPDVAAVDAMHVSGKEAGAIVVRAQLYRGVEPVATARQIAVVMESVTNPDRRRLRAAKIIRNEYAARNIFNVDAPDHRAVAVAQLAAWTGDPGYLFSELRTYAGLDVDAAFDRVRPYLRASDAHVALVEPAGGAKAAAPAVQRPLIDVANGSRPRTDAELRGLRATAVLAGRREETLENGLQIVVLPRRGVPVVTVKMAFHGGDSGPPVAAALAPWARRYIARGEMHFTYVADAHKDRHADLETYRTPPSNLGWMLDAIAELGAATPDEWPTTWVEAATTQLRARFGKPREQARAAFERRLFGAHPFSASAALREAKLDDGNRKAIRAWLETSRVGGNALLVIAGDVDGEAALARARLAFSRWPKGAALPVPPPLAETPLDAAADAVIAYDDGARQVQVRLGCAFPALGGVFALEVVRAVLAGEAKSRVRQREGAAYDVSAGAQLLRGGIGLIEAETNVRSAELAAALGSLLSVWRTERVSADVLSDAKWRLLRTLPFRGASSSGLAALTAAVWARGGQLSEVDDAASAIIALTPADIEATLTACRARTVLSLVGDRAAIRTGYEAAFHRDPPAPVP